MRRVLGIRLGAGWGRGRGGGGAVAQVSAWRDARSVVGGASACGACVRAWCGGARGRVLMNDTGAVARHARLASALTPRLGAPGRVPVAPSAHQRPDSSVVQTLDGVEQARQRRLRVDLRTRTRNHISWKLFRSSSMCYCCAAGVSRRVTGGVPILTTGNTRWRRRRCHSPWGALGG